MAIQSVNFQQYRTELDTLARTVDRLRHDYQLDLNTLHTPDSPPLPHEEIFARHILILGNSVTLLIRMMETQFDHMKKDSADV